MKGIPLKSSGKASLTLSSLPGNMDGVAHVVRSSRACPRRECHE